MGRIDEILGRSGISKAEAARRMGKNESTIYRIENDARRVNFGSILDFCKVVNCLPHELIDGFELEQKKIVIPRNYKILMEEFTEMIIKKIDEKT